MSDLAAATSGQEAKALATVTAPSGPQPALGCGGLHARTCGLAARAVGYQHVVLAEIGITEVIVMVAIVMLAAASVAIVVLAAKSGRGGS